MSWADKKEIRMLQSCYPGYRLVVERLFKMGVCHHDFSYREDSKHSARISICLIYLRATLLLPKFR